MKKFIFLSLLLGMNLYLVHYFAHNSIDLFLYQINHFPTMLADLFNNFNIDISYFLDLTNGLDFQSVLILFFLTVLGIYFFFLNRFWSFIGLGLVLIWSIVFPIINIYIPKIYQEIVLISVYPFITLFVYLMARRQDKQQKWLQSIENDLKSKKWHQIKENYMADQVNQMHLKISQELKELQKNSSYQKIKLLQNQVHEALHFPAKVFEKRADGLLTQRCMNAPRYYENFYEEHQQWIRQKLQTEKAYFRGKKENDLTYQDKDRLENILRYLNYDLVKMYEDYQVVKSVLESGNNPKINELYKQFKKPQTVESLDSLLAIHQQIQEYISPEKIKN